MFDMTFIFKVNNISPVIGWKITKREYILKHKQQLFPLEKG